MEHIKLLARRIWGITEWLGRRLRPICSWLGQVADPVSKWTTTLALLIGGGWAFYQFALGGAANWTINLALTTEVVPYHNNLALLVVHVKSKNPTNKEFDFDAPNASFRLKVRKIPDNLKRGAIADPEQGELITNVNMLPADGYTFLPNAEFDDVTSVVLPVGSTVTVTADLEQLNGSRTKGGKPDYDYVSTSKIVIVTP